jgi:hypothetical protein
MATPPSKVIEPPSATARTIRRPSTPFIPGDPAAPGSPFGPVAPAPPGSPLGPGTQAASVSHPSAALRTIVVVIAGATVSSG